MKSVIACNMYGFSGFSSVPVKSICKVKRTEDSPLSTVHLEYNYIDVMKIPRAAFSCIRDSSKIILEPQSQTQG